MFTKTKYSSLVGKLLYLAYFVSGCGFLFGRSESLAGLLTVPGYYAWAILMFISTTLLLLGALSGKDWVEVLGTLPAAASVFVYAVALWRSPPQGEHVVGMALAFLVATTGGWLIVRFLSLYSHLGNRRATLHLDS